MQFPDDACRDVQVRLRRIEGQIRGIQRLIDEGAQCQEVVTQLSAASAALDRVGFKLLTAGLRECLKDPDADLDTDEIEKMFLKLA